MKSIIKQTLSADEVRSLVARFLEGDTTLQEEQALYAYFRQSAVAPDLLSMKDFFLDLDNAELAGAQSKAQQAEERPNVRASSFRPYYGRAITGIAATLCLLFALSAWRWKQYDNLLAHYGGSYVIVEGKRIDDLRKIEPHIYSTLRTADSIQAQAAFISRTEERVLKNITDPELRFQLEQMLKP